MKLFAILLCIAAAYAEKTFYGDQVLRVYPRSHQLELFDHLEQQYGVDLWTHVGTAEPVDIHVNKINVDLVKFVLKQHNVKHEVMISDLQANIDAETDRKRPAQLSLADFDYNVYHTRDEIMQWMDNMEAAYSSVSIITAGTSYEKNSIKAMKISSGVSGNPAFVINCGIHAREWVSPATCMHVAKYLVEAGMQQNYLSSVDYYILPTSNPDGYDYTWSGDRMWRKTRSDNGFRCMGVDPNRNFDVNWSGPGASASPCNDAYYGPSAFSEVETQLQRDFVGSLPGVTAYIDIHAYSQYWMFPYAYTYLHTSDHTILTQIGDESVAAIAAVHGKVYQSGPISQVIYQASGSSVDYTYDKLGIKCSFAAELRDTGRYGFILPENQIQPTAEETFAGLQVIASYVANGTC